MHLTLQYAQTVTTFVKIFVTMIMQRTIRANSSSVLEPYYNKKTKPLHMVKVLSTIYRYYI